MQVKNSDDFTDIKVPFKELELNINYIKNIFAGDETIIARYVSSPYNAKMRFCLVYTDGMVNNKLLNDDVICPLLKYRFAENGEEDTIGTIASNATFSNSAEKTADMEEITQGIVYGDTALFADGCQSALMLNTKGWATRGITEPESERVLRGPREGFTESILENLSMLRRKIRTPDLKMEFMTFGRRTKTKTCICYIKSLANDGILNELKQRLKKVDIDGVLDSNYISEIIRDSPYVPIKTVGSTERPDIVAAKLLEGRIAMFVDGSPVVLTVPHLFIEHFQSDEDYYINYYFASIGRLLRIMAFFLSISLPAIYLSLVSFHQEMLPTALLISISSSRQGVPFPSALETLLMLVVFETLREAGARMPGIMGQTLSIVGALVIGQAAVNAKLVSAPIIIVVSLTAICGLMVVRLKGFSIICRFFLILASCVLGLYGYLMGILVILVLLFSMTSFGVPIMPDVYARDFQDYKDIYIRYTWKGMIKRPVFLSKDPVRQSTGGKKNG